MKTTGATISESVQKIIDASVKGKPFTAQLARLLEEATVITSYRVSSRFMNNGVTSRLMNRSELDTDRMYCLLLGGASTLKQNRPNRWTYAFNKDYWIEFETK